MLIDNEKYSIMAKSAKFKTEEEILNFIFPQMSKTKEHYLKVHVLLNTFISLVTH